MKVLLILTVCIAAATAGVVNFQSCIPPGSGRVVQVRIEGCSGDICEMIPGNGYLAEVDIIPAVSSPCLHLNIMATFQSLPIPISDFVIPNSEVKAGQMYTIRHVVVPSPNLIGNTVPVETKITHTNTSILESCFIILVKIIESRN